jgi:site-specific DNA recombinase
LRGDSIFIKVQEMKRKPLSINSNTGRMNTILAVIYVRVSSPRQKEEGFSIPAQLQFLREYGASKGMVIVNEFIDDETARSVGRTQFGSMLKYLRKHPEVRCVLAEKVDRLYRNSEDEVKLAKLDPEIHFVKENTVHSRHSRASEKFVHRIRVAVSENYSDNLSEETIKGMTEKARQGIWPSAAPIGYLNVQLPSAKRGIIPDPERASLVRRCYELYATGCYSMRALAKWALENGLRFRKSGKPVNKATLNVILHNPIYYGGFMWNGRMYAGSHEAIVSVDLWQRVQEVAAGRYAQRHRVVKHDLAFAGLMRCGHCGCAMVGEIKKERYVYYHCSRGKGKCPENGYAREEVIEAQFTGAIRRIILPPDLVDWAAQVLSESQRDATQIQTEAIQRLKAEHTRVQKRLDEMYLDKLDRRITVDDYERRAGEWNGNLQKLARQIREKEEATSPEHVIDAIELLKLAKNAGNLFEKQSAKEKGRLLKLVLSNSTWKDGKLTVTYRQPFDLFDTWRKQMEENSVNEGVKNGRNEIWLLR